MFKRLWQIRDRGVFWNFLVSYIVILVVPVVVIGTFIYGRILAELEGEVRRSNQMLLRQVSDVVDLRMRELGLLAGQISLNPRVRDFLFRPAAGPAGILSTLDLLKDMAIFQAPNRFIHNLIIYSFKADAIASTAGRYTPRFFFAEVCRPEGASYEEWLRGLRAEQFQAATAAAPYVVEGRREQRFLTYTQSLPTNEGLAAGTLVAFVSSDRIEQLFEPLVSQRGGAAFIVNREGNVLISAGDTIPGPWKFQDDSGFTRLTLAGERMVVSFQKAGSADWYYVSAIPARVLNARVSAIRGLMLLVFALCLVVGVAVATVLSWRNYRPIQAILGVLAPLRPKGGRRRRDEFAEIMDTAREAVRENRSLREYLEQNRVLVEAGLLRRLLTGRIPEGERAGALRSLGHAADSPYAVLVVDVDAPFRPEATVLAAADGIQRSVECLVTEVEDGRLGVLVAGRGERAMAAESEAGGSGADAGEAAADQAAHDAARRIQEALDRQFGISASIGFSVAAGPVGVPRAFREAVQAADYRIVRGRSAITAFNQITQADNSYYYPLDHERHLINHVKSGDFAAVSDMVDEVYSENFVRRRLPVRLARCVFYDLMGTVLKVLQELNLDQREVLGPGLEADRWLAEAHTAADMHDRLKQVYARACKWIVDHRESHNTRLKEQVLAALDEGFADPNLSLTLVADQMQVSSSYLCRFFKDHTGYNFADYVNRLRVEQARKLLRNQSLSVADVATAVGYLSANTFIRVFKKYEGVTPGHYRSGSGPLPPGPPELM